MRQGDGRGSRWRPFFCRGRLAGWCWRTFRFRSRIPFPWTGGVVALTAFPLMAGVTYDHVDETAQGFYKDEAGIPTLDLTYIAQLGLEGRLPTWIEACRHAQAEGTA